MRTKNYPPKLGGVARSAGVVPTNGLILLNLSLPLPPRPVTCTYSVRRNAMGLVDRSLVYSRQVQTAYRDGGPGHVVFSVAKKALWPVCQLGYLMFFEKDLAT